MKDKNKNFLRLKSQEAIQILDLLEFVSLVFANADLDFRKRKFEELLVSEGLRKNRKWNHYGFHFEGN